MDVFGELKCHRTQKSAKIAISGWALNKLDGNAFIIQPLDPAPAFDMLLARGKGNTEGDHIAG